MKNCLTLLVFMMIALMSSTAFADRRQREDINKQLARLKDIQAETGIGLSSNRDFHEWIIENSRQTMPKRLEDFWSNLSEQNMKRRLFYIYKWAVGRSAASRRGYIEWLSGLADWFEDNAASE